jgi:transketolase
VALLFSRQNVEVIDRSNGVAGAAQAERGGYVVWDSQPDGIPELILIATGAEVPPALAAGRQLAAQGTPTRVVSMPCVELFEAQPVSYRQQVVPTDVPARLAIEPGATLGWWKWVGDRGDVFGLDRFGASAPGTTVLEKFGFTTDGIASRARELLTRIEETKS